MKHALRLIQNLFRKSNPDKETLLLWAALRDLNEKVIKSGACLESVKATYLKFQLKGNVRTHYLSSVIPLLCQNNEFEGLIDWQDLSFLTKSTKKRNAWTLSIRLPVLVMYGRLQQASQLFQELNGKLTDGWISTEAVRFSMEKVQQFEKSGLITGDYAQQFRILFFNLLDALPGGWYSRLHDAELIKTAIVLLQDLETYTDEHRKYIVSAIIKHYGLCMSFWKAYQHHGSEDEPMLIQARRNWEMITDYIHFPTKGNDHELISAITWFHERLNPDAIYFLRIFMAHASSQQQVDFSALLEKISPADAARLQTNTIWPTYMEPSENPSKNKLELVSDAGFRDEQLKHEPLVISVVRNEMLMLPHFLAHYRKLGIKGFVFVDNGSTDGSFEYLCSQPDVVLYQTNTEYRESHYGVAWQQAVLGNHCLGKWVLLADADELLVYPGYEERDLQTYLREVSAAGADTVMIYMIDMYPYGDLETADLTKQTPFEAASWCDAKPLIEWKLGSGQYSNGTNYLSAMRHRLAPHSPPNAFMSQKYACVRYQPWMRWSAGLHNAVIINLGSHSAMFAHFKYHAGFKKKVMEEIAREQHYNNAQEYKEYVKFMKGGFYDKTSSMQFDCDRIWQSFGRTI